MDQTEAVNCKVGAPSHDGLLAEVLPAQRSHAIGGRVQSPTNGGRGLLWYLFRAAFAIVAIVALGFTNLASPLDGFAADDPSSPWALGSEPLHQRWERAHAGPVGIDLAVVETELEDDELDPLGHNAKDAPVVADVHAFSHKSGRISRGEPQVYTLFVAIGMGLPRGPPVA